VPTPLVLLFGLAPGDAYPAGYVTTTAVGSYSTISPLPEPAAKLALLPAIGGVFSVAQVSDRSAWALPSTLPCGVRTFLPNLCSGDHLISSNAPYTITPLLGWFKAALD
jgi:hypothetical protein